MAMQEGTSDPAPSAQVVGNVFVEQYYHSLHQSPELVLRFYRDSSLLSRPDANGNMGTVTTMQHAINQKILDFNSEDYVAEIKTTDALDSYQEGVLVLVTGCLTGKNGLRRKFTQTFFLAPQDRDYFVLNDVCRYIEDDERLQANFTPVNSVNENVAVTALTTEPVFDHAPEPPVEDPAAFEGDDLNDGAKVSDPSDKKVAKPSTDANRIEVLTEVDSAVVHSAPAAEDDAPRKSYASIVKVMRGETSNTVHVPTRTLRVAPANTNQQPLGSTKPASAPEASVPTSGIALESFNVPEKAPRSPILQCNLAILSLRRASKEEVEVTLKNLESTLASYPDSGIVHATISLAQYKMASLEKPLEKNMEDQLLEAFDSLQQAIALSPGNNSFAGFHGRLLFKIEQLYRVRRCAKNKSKNLVIPPPPLPNVWPPQRIMKDDRERLPEHRDMIPEEDLCQAVLDLFGRNIKEDVKVIQCHKWTGGRGLGFRGSDSNCCPEALKELDLRIEEESRWIQFENL